MRRKMSLILVLGLAGCAAPGGSKAKTDECSPWVVGKPSYCPRDTGMYPTGVPGLSPNRMPRTYDPTRP